jgi:hypothetical protein
VDGVGLSKKFDLGVEQKWSIEIFRDVRRTESLFSKALVSLSRKARTISMHVPCHASHLQSSREELDIQVSSKSKCLLEYPFNHA